MRMFGFRRSHLGVSVGKVSSGLPLTLLRNGPKCKTEPKSPSIPDMHVDAHATGIA